MANTKISQLTALTNPTGNEELVYAYNNTNGKMTVDTVKSFVWTWKQDTLVSWVNIKTINNTSILWSWNIDVSWWGGGSWPTELAGDANIWELSEWNYVTTHNLYYKSWQYITSQWFWTNYKTYIRVIDDWASPNDKWYFALNVDGASTHWESSMWFWSSTSSSVWSCYPIKDNTYMLSYNRYWVTKTISWTSISIWWWNIWITVDSLSWSYTLDTYGVNTYVGMEHYLYIPTQTNNYTLTANWVNNPFNVTLPSSTTKGCLVKFFCPASNKMILTECLIEQ